MAPARASARPAASRGSGPQEARSISPALARRAALEHREARRGGAERAGDADEVARAGAVPADERVAGGGPADDGDREREHGARDDVAAGDRRPGRLRQRLGAARAARAPARR